ncbi:MAG: tRNA (adenosine(37)-N6)-threonylcarbamoyltransferase complex ATPase subunit type 1 TsaE [Herpetosiphon sp.]
MDATCAWQCFSTGEAETIALGRQIGAHLRPGDVLLLHGPFGAGKTHFTKGLASALGVPQDQVNSPSFVLVNQYDAIAAGRALPIYHADLYRLAGIRDVLSIGLEELADGPGITVVEWPEHGAGLLPAEHLWISFDIVGATERRISVEPRGARYIEMVRDVAAGAG